VSTLRFVTMSILALLASCAGVQHAPSPPLHAPLRVGVSPDTAPYVFWRGDQLAGLEIDMAIRLAQDLGRPLQLVQLRWQEQIPALLDGRTDVIMSGMSITPARAVMVAFSEPYLQTSLMGLIRIEDAQRYPSPEALIASSPRIGVKTGTTAETYVREHRPTENIVRYTMSQDAVTELRNRRIDVFVSDAPVIIWAASRYGNELVAPPRRVGAESLGWAFRPDNAALRLAANQTLARWKTDGTLAGLLAAWPTSPG